MTELDRTDAILDESWAPPEVDDMALERKPKVCRHDWVVNRHWNGGPTSEPPIVQCVRCNRVRDEVAAKRGKSARRLGGDQERRIEKVYGPVKIGERGDPVDHLGRVWRWQSKATRGLPPKWLAAITEPTYRAVVPFALERAYDAMAGHYDPRGSVVIRSFVSRGVRARDWLFVDAADGAAELALAHPVGTSTLGFWVIPGDWWLDHFGRDDG